MGGEKRQEQKRRQRKKQRERQGREKGKGGLEEDRRMRMKGDVSLRSTPEASGSERKEEEEQDQGCEDLDGEAWQEEHSGARATFHHEEVGETAISPKGTSFTGVDENRGMMKKTNDSFRSTPENSGRRGRTRSMG